MAADTAMELKKHNVASISIWPGAVETETIKSSANGVGVRSDMDRVLLKCYISFES